MLPGAYPLAALLPEALPLSRPPVDRGDNAALAVENDGAEAPVDAGEAAVEAPPPLGNSKPALVVLSAIESEPGTEGVVLGVNGFALVAPGERF